MIVRSRSSGVLFGAVWNVRLKLNIIKTDIWRWRKWITWVFFMITIFTFYYYLSATLIKNVTKALKNEYKLHYSR